MQVPVVPTVHENGVVQYESLKFRKFVTSKEMDDPGKFITSHLCTNRW